MPDKIWERLAVAITCFALLLAAVLLSLMVAMSIDMWGHVLS